MSELNRDRESGKTFSELYKLGCFDEAFIVYGCGYYQDNEITYLVSDEEEKICRFRNDAILYHIYTTPIVRKQINRQVASGEREIIRQHLKLELAKEIKGLYSKKYYQCMKALDQVQSNQQAVSLLQDEQQKLDGYFNRSDIECFECLCKLAYQCKKVNEQSYQSFMQWIKYAKKQMENDIILKSDLHRIFSGFAYEQNGITKYYVDAQPKSVYKKREELLLAGALVTPIITKEYWFKRFNELAKIKDNFLEHLHAMSENGLIDKTRMIISYESPVDIHVLDGLQPDDLTETEKEGLKLYQHMLGVYSKCF